MRCQHERISIIKRRSETLTQVREAGEWVRIMRAEDPRTVLVHCRDCGLLRRFGDRGKPKWLREAIEEAKDAAIAAAFAEDPEQWDL